MGEVFYDKEELFNIVETNNPKLWNKYMEQIELEQEALDYLVSKYKWNEE